MPWLGRLRLDQIKIIAPIKFLLEVLAQGDSYRVIISLVNGQIILIVVYIHCSYNVKILMLHRINKTNILHLINTNGTISIALLYFLYSHVLEQLSVITRASPEQVLARFDVRHGVQGVTLLIESL